MLGTDCYGATVRVFLEEDSKRVIGLVSAPDRGQGLAEMLVGRRVLRILLGDLLENRDRFLKLTLPYQRVPKQLQRFRVRRIHRQLFAAMVSRDVRLVGLQGLEGLSQGCFLCWVRICHG